MMAGDGAHWTMGVIPSAGDYIHLARGVYRVGQVERVCSDDDAPVSRVWLLSEEVPEENEDFTQFLVRDLVDIPRQGELFVLKGKHFRIRLVQWFIPPVESDYVILYLEQLVGEDPTIAEIKQKDAELGQESAAPWFLR